MAAKKRPSSLGRGLDALLGGGDASASAEAEGELRTLATASIQPGRYQPRQRFDAEPLEELAASIRGIVRLRDPESGEELEGAAGKNGPVIIPLRVVAPTSVNRGRSSRIERAVGPLPMTMSSWKSSIAG